MKEIKIYTFTEQEFKQTANLADEIFNTSVVLKGFCESDSSSENLQNILPVIKFLYQNSDILNSIFIKLQTTEGSKAIINN